MKSRGAKDSHSGAHPSPTDLTDNHSKRLVMMSYSAEGGLFCFMYLAINFPKTSQIKGMIDEIKKTSCSL